MGRFLICFFRADTGISCDCKASNKLNESPALNIQYSFMGLETVP